MLSRCLREFQSLEVVRGSPPMSRKTAGVKGSVPVHKAREFRDASFWRKFYNPTEGEGVVAVAREGYHTRRDISGVGTLGERTVVPLFGLLDGGAKVVCVLDLSGVAYTKQLKPEPSKRCSRCFYR